MVSRVYSVADLVVPMGVYGTPNITGRQQRSAGYNAPGPANMSVPSVGGPQAAFNGAAGFNGQAFAQINDGFWRSGSASML